MDKPDIKVEEYLAGPQGMNFIVYPVKDVHTAEDLEATKAQIRRDRDVVTLRTVWLRKETKDA
jgi:hypothetical protein